MKCPQLSKPEATAARNQNSIGDRTEKKTLGETRLSRGAISPLARRHNSSIPTAAKNTTCLTKLLFKQQIKREIIHLLYKIIDDESNCYVDNKRLMKLKKSNDCCTVYVE